MYLQNYYIQPAVRLLKDKDKKYIHDTKNGPAVLAYLNGLSYENLCKVKIADLESKYHTELDNERIASIIDAMIQSKFSRQAKTSQTLAGVNCTGFPPIDKTNQRPFLRTRRLICPECGEDLTTDLMNQIQGNEIVDHSIIAVVCPVCGAVIEGTFSELCPDPLDIGSPSRHLSMAVNGGKSKPAREGRMHRENMRRQISRLLREDEDTGFVDPPKVFDPYPVQSVKPVSVKVLPDEKPKEPVSGWLKQPSSNSSDDLVPKDLEGFKASHITSDNGLADSDEYDPYVSDSVIDAVLDGEDPSTIETLMQKGPDPEPAEDSEINFEIEDNLDLDFEDDFSGDTTGPMDAEIDFEVGAPETLSPGQMSHEEGTIELEDDFETVSLINGYLDGVHVSLENGKEGSSKEDFEPEAGSNAVDKAIIGDKDSKKEDPFEITFGDIPL